MSEELRSSSDEVIIGGDEVVASDELPVSVSIMQDPDELSDETSHPDSSWVPDLSVGKAIELFSKLDHDGLGEDKMLYALPNPMAGLGTGNIVG